MEVIPVPSPPQPKVEDQLGLLATFHYVVAALGALFACLPLIHVAIGLMFILHPAFLTEGQHPAPPPWFGLIFVLFGGVFVLMGWAMAVCTFLSGRFLARRRHRMFSMVVAGLLCMFAPFGTVLGVFTIIALSKDSVQQLYLTNHSA